ncbi:MAG TPA: hypothetical protein VHM26_08490 [Chitinophagaceae bacterium]|nr:hypothetical protein [Chitinophagaceae bacterium]
MRQIIKPLKSKYTLIYSIVGKSFVVIIKDAVTINIFDLVCTGLRIDAFPYIHPLNE